LPGNLAIIPARSGSKGLPAKNILPLAGKPLLAHSVAAALDSGMFAEVMVSTDAERYAAVAREHGAAVPFLRSAATSSDTASSWDAVREVVDRYAAQGRDFDTVTLLQPTSPLRTETHIREAFAFFAGKQAHAVISVCAAEHSPLWSFSLEADRNLKTFAQRHEAHANRQALPTYYRLNGAVYLLDAYAVRHMSTLYTNRCYAYVMEQEASVDIDSALDFAFAEFLMQRHQA